VSESNEEQNEFAGDPAVETAAEEAAPEPKAVAAAVQQALAEQHPVPQIQLAGCPCGVANVNLLIDLPQGSKVGRAGCSACGVWGVDFLAPRTQDQELVGQHAAKAWNEAPRAV
jgi:hypothetical protein